MVSPGLTGAGGFNPHKRTPQQASTQQAVQGKSEPTDSPNQSQQIPEVYARVTQQQGYQQNAAQSQFVYPDIALGSDVMKPIMQPHYTSPPGHISVRGTKYQFPPGSIQQGIQRSIPPQIQQASPGQSQQMQRPMVVPQQQYTQRLQSVNQQQRPINAPMQPSYQQSVMPNATTQKHELLQNSPKALLGTLLQQVPSEYQPQFLTLYSKLQSKQIGCEEFLARAKEILSLGNPKRLALTPQQKPAQSIHSDPSSPMFTQMSQQVDPKMQQNAQNGFQRVVTPQGQMPQFQQAQPAMTGYNPYQYIIPQNYPDISFQQQHIKAKQPQNSRMPPFSKPPSGMSTAGAGDKTQIQKMPQANNGELFSGQEYTSLHDIKQSPNISTPISNESNPVLSQGAQGIFPYRLNQVQMQGPIYGPETTNQELNAQAYPVLMQKPRKSQKTKQQKSNALSQFPLAEDPPSFAQQRPQVQSPAIAPRQQQVNVQKQAVSEPPIKMEPGTAPKQPPQSKQQPEPDQHQPQPKEKDTSRIDMQSMIDVTSYTSINLKQEEENIINAIIPNYDNLGITFSTTDADRTEVDSFLDFDALGLRLDAIARVNGLKFTDRRLMSFVSVAVRNLIRDLLERMSIASKHRSGITHKKLIASDRSQKDSNCEYSLDFNIIVTDDTKEALSKIKEGEMQIDKKLREKLGLPIIPEEVEQETPEEEQKPQDAEQKDGESKDPPPADAAATPEDQTPTQTPGSSTLPTSAIPSADSVAPAPAPSKRKKKASKIRDLPDVIKVRNTNEVIMAALGGVPLKSWMATASSSTFNFLSKPNQKDQAAGGKLDNKSRIITVVPLKRKADAHDGEESLKPENSDKKEEKTHESKDETANDGKSQEIKEEPADASLPRIPADSKYWSKIGIASDKTCIPGMVTADHTTNKDFEADDKGHKITLRDALFCLQMQRNFCKSPVLHKWLMR